MQGLMKLACNMHTFDTDVIFGDGENVSAVGRFVYSGKKIGRKAETPFSIYAKVRDGKIYYFQFFEDTYCTAACYRESGAWDIKNAAGSTQVGS